MLLALSETWYLFFLCLCIAMTAWMVFLWGVRSGQFKDTEETAERMLELDDRSEALPDPKADRDASSTLGGHEPPEHRVAANATGSDTSGQDTR